MQVPIVSRAEVLRGVLNFGKLLEESSGGVVSARPAEMGCAGFVFTDAAATLVVPREAKSPG